MRSRQHEPWFNKLTHVDLTHNKVLLMFQISDAEKIMFDTYEPYIPETVGELLDQLTSMTGAAPTFADSLGFFPRTIETEFRVLNEGLKAVRKKIGEERYALCVEMANRMRALFEADPEDVNGQAQAGRELIFAMEDVLKKWPARQ